MIALFPFLEELGPSGLCLSNKDRSRLAFKIIFLHRHPSATDDDQGTAALQAIHNLVHALPLDAHPRDSHNVGPLQTREVDRLDVLVYDRDRVFRG